MKEATQKALRAFAKLAGFVDQRRKEEVQEYEDFLSFYKVLVEETPVSAVQSFGRMDVTVCGPSIKRADKKEVWGILLTVADYLWWESHVREQGTRFFNGPSSVRRSMLDRMSRQAEQMAATPEQRKHLLELLRDQSDT